MKTRQQQKIWDANYKQIVDIIRKHDPPGVTAKEIRNLIRKSLSRTVIHKYLKAAVGKGDIVEDKRCYFSREFEDRKQKAKEAYRKILGFTEEDLRVRAGLPWFGRSDFTLAQFAPEKYLDSGKLVHNDILKRRSKLGDKKRAKLEALNYTDAFLRNIKVEIETSIKEVKLQSGHRVTKIAAFLPFLQKVEKGWDAEVYDKATWIMYRFFREIALPSSMITPSDEIVITIKLNPYDFKMRLFDAVYTFKRLEALKYRPSIFPEIQKNAEYQALEKTWQAGDEKRRKEFFEQDPLLHILDRAKQPEDAKT